METCVRWPNGLASSSQLHASRKKNIRKSVAFNRKFWDENYLDRKFILSSFTEKKLKFREFKPGLFTEGKEPIVFRWEANGGLGEEASSWPCQPLTSSGPGFEPAPLWREASALTTAPFLLFQ